MNPDTNPKSEETERRDEARQFILDAIEDGASPFEILDELGTFFDGDPCELF